MIDNEILDAIIPVPDLEEKKDEVVKELGSKGFVITNFASGGVWYHLLMIFLRIYIEIKNLTRTVLNNMYVSHASKTWLDLKVSDYSKVRKVAQKTQGLVTISRKSGATDGEAIKIAVGQVFKTEKDINGEELRFFVIEAAVLQKGSLSVDVLVEAEKEGVLYNVSAGQISRSLTYIGEVEINNHSGWISREGSDIEDDESLRSRTKRSWADLAQRPIRDTYRNAAESVPGVLFAQVEDQHPRGQGTIDVIVTGTAGNATPALLSEVETAINQIIGPYDNVLIRSAITVTQPVSISFSIQEGASIEDATARASSVITTLLAMGADRALNELLHEDIIHEIKKGVAGAKNISVASPASDMILDKDRVILLGELTIDVTQRKG